jgi:ComF family protein
VCRDCKSTVVIRPLALCPSCGRASAGGRRHPDCKGALDALVAPLPYAQPLIRDAIKHYKYHGVQALEPFILAQAALSARAQRTLFPASPTVVPLPLHPSRERERGFNQAERIGRAVADALQSTVAMPLKRVRRTDHQAELSTHERLENCNDAFVSEPITGDVVLVDDVVTTGATMQAAAAALKSAGARSVTGFALAHG